MLQKKTRVRSKLSLAEYRETHPCCEVCGGTQAGGYANAGGVHHIVYRSRGGGDDHSNLIVLCSRCHTEAHTGKIKPEYLRACKRGMP